MNEKVINIHIKSIEKSIVSLKNLHDNVLKNKINDDFILSATSSILALLCSSANSLDNGKRCTNYDNFQDWKNLMVVIHRSFFSIIHITTELEIDKIIETHGIIVTPSVFKKILSKINKLEQNNQTVMQLKKELEKKSHISFQDKIDSILRHYKFNKSKKSEWKYFFNGLTILRNKCSHSNSKINTYEQNILNNSCLKKLIRKDSITMNTGYYTEIINKLYDFLEITK